MSYDEIVRDYSDFPRESVPELLRFAAETLIQDSLPGSNQRHGIPLKGEFISLKVTEESATKIAG
jgi:hypothetical protein